MTDAQVVSPAGSSGARIVHNATDSTCSGAESANSLPSADNPLVSSTLQVKYFATLVQLWHAHTITCSALLCGISSFLTKAAIYTASN